MNKFGFFPAAQAFIGNVVVHTPYFKPWWEVGSVWFKTKGFYVAWYFAQLTPITILSFYCRRGFIDKSFFHFVLLFLLRSELETGVSKDSNRLFVLLFPQLVLIFSLCIKLINYKRPFRSQNKRNTTISKLKASSILIISLRFSKRQLHNSFLTNVHH